MVIRQINYARKFVHRWKKLTIQEKRNYQKIENIFKKNCYDSKLKTHKLTGKLKEYWSFSIDYKQRVIFRFSDNNSVLFYDFGGHEIYR